MPDKTGGIVAGITGASGALLGYRLLGRLRELAPAGTRLRVVMTETARQVWRYELPYPLPEADGFEVYPNNNLFADVASGSAGYETMIVCPCSMGTAGRIAAGTSDGLLARAADVMLKERRRLVLVIREAPLSLIHLRNLTALTEAGAIVFPAAPFYYHKPSGIDELIDPLIGRILETAGISANSVRWGG